MSRLDHLWAGWRSAYIEGATGADAQAAEGEGAGGGGSGASGRSGVGGAAGDGDEEEATQAGATNAAGATNRCVFCRILASGEADVVTHVLWRHPDGTAVALLNAYPYTSGHLMVMPVRHARRLDELSAGESAAIWEGIGLALRAIETAYRPEGINLGANLGRAAGAGVPDHLHVHALPRWVGDTNFTTAVAGLRVLPEALDVSAAKLRAAWPRDLRPAGWAGSS